MSSSLFAPRRFSNSEIAFAVVVLAAFIVYLTTIGYALEIDTTLLVIGLSLLYLAIGIYGDRYINEHRTLVPVATYIIIELIIGSVVIYLSQGQSWLILLPMVGTAVEYLSKPWSILVAALVWVDQIVLFLLLYDLDAALGWAVPFAAAVVFVGVFTQATVSERRARSELAQAHEKLREYAAQVEQLAVVQERNRLAREIHDGLGHYLSAINIQIRAAQATADQDFSQTKTALNNAEQLTQEALADVRRSISSLRADPTTSRPLPETLGRMLAEIGTNDLQTNLTISGTPRPLSQQAEFAFYRFTQEGLTNIRKHSRATQVVMRLEYLDQLVRLTLQDNGIGAEQATGGFGLLGLRERSELLGGRLVVDSSPGQGFKLLMEIPA